MSDITAPAETVLAEGAPVAGAAVVAKVARRLMWFVMALYFMAILDRGNISFAALSMNHDIGLNAQMFGISVGVMYFTYSLFEIPSNLFLGKYGARATLTRIAILWGIATMLLALTTGPLSLYSFRGLLGLAESGLFPGVMLFLSLWFPFRYRARYNAMFNYGVPISYLVASLISGAILNLDGVAGIAGWKWLFILEGLPAVLLGVIGIFYLTDRPAEARWLAPEEKAWLEREIDSEARQSGTIHGANVLKSILQPTVLLFAVCNFGHFCALATLFAWLPQIVKSHGLTNTQVGLVTAIPALTGLVGMILLSRHSDRLGERFYYTVFTLLLAACGFAIAGLSSDLPLIVVGFMIANAGVYGTQAIFWTIPQTYLSRTSAPGAIGFISTIGSIGGAIIPIVVGRIKDTSGNYTGGFLTVTGVLVVSALCILATRPRLIAASPA